MGRWSWEPRNQTLSLDGTTGKNVGLWLSIVNDNVYVLKETDVYADFSVFFD